ncbi:MAG: hypothetical protein DRJ03_01835 [Chloroflexi bacterium]|nr:MAG: hypothetical protein DRJ03_01835 [Chloroflexota bacterium]
MQKGVYDSYVLNSIPSQQLLHLVFPTDFPFQFYLIVGQDGASEKEILVPTRRLVAKKRSAFLLDENVLIFQSD